MEIQFGVDETIKGGNEKYIFIYVNYFLKIKC